MNFFIKRLFLYSKIILLIVIECDCKIQHLAEVLFPCAGLKELFILKHSEIFPAGHLIKNEGIDLVVIPGKTLKLTHLLPPVVIRIIRIIKRSETCLKDPPIDQ